MLFYANFFHLKWPSSLSIIKMWRLAQSHCQSISDFSTVAGAAWSTVSYVHRHISVTFPLYFPHEKCCPRVCVQFTGWKAHQHISSLRLCDSLSPRPAPNTASSLKCCTILLVWAKITNKNDIEMIELVQLVREQLGQLAFTLARISLSCCVNSYS